MWLRVAVMSVLVSAVVAAVLAVGPGCTGTSETSPCGRSSDCAAGLVCSSAGACGVPVTTTDGGADGSGGDVDASRIPPGLDADDAAP